MLNSLVRQLISEGRPASIKNRLCHAGFGESGCVYITHSNVVELSHYAMRELMYEVASTVDNFRVQTFCQTILIGPLRFTKTIFKMPVVAWVLNLFASREGGKFLEAEVNPDTIAYFSRAIRIDLNNQVQVPVTTRVPGKIGAVAYLPIRELPTIEHPESAAMETEALPVPLNMPTLKWNPPKGFLATKSEIRTFFLGSRYDVLRANSGYRRGMQTKLLAAPGSKADQVEGGVPLATITKGVFLPFVAIVPHEVYRAGLLVQ